MSEHQVSVTWNRETPGFGYEEYNREHSWRFGGGTVVRASAAPDYLGQPACATPEEAFVASLSSCHMLFVLAIASKKRLIVEQYTDHAVGHLEKGPDGKPCVTRVVLRPEVTFGGDRRPSVEQILAIHDKAHYGCFIARSVRTDVRVEPVLPERH